MITETIQYSLHSKKRPVYLLSLDAQSAFDRCLRQILICKLYEVGVSPSAISLIDKRLENRATIYEWNGTLLGPSTDTTGFEQGGINSSDFYKLYNNEQLATAQASTLGVDIGSTIVSAVGQADDVVLISNDLDSLNLLCKLTEKYCSNYRVKLVPSKTKLLAFHTNNQHDEVQEAKKMTDIVICGEKIDFVANAEHVGIVRSSSGNMPHILSRITAHKKAVRSVLSAGAAKNHSGNPTASLRIHSIYGSSVLFSGIASLCLSAAEVRTVAQHFQQTVQNIQKLPSRTPRSFVFLMAGCLPGEAIIELKQLTLFLMICYKQDDILHQHAKFIIMSAQPSCKSWFQNILKLCVKYRLPHPFSLLESPPPKLPFKRELKKAVIRFWEEKLRAEAHSLHSLEAFSPIDCSLRSPHILWVTAGSNSFEIRKSFILAKMMSGRYRTDYLARHWSPNADGSCQLPTCSGGTGDLEHLLAECSALSNLRRSLELLALQKANVLYPLHLLLASIFQSNFKTYTLFLLNPLSFHEITNLANIYGFTVLKIVYYCVRTFAYYIHRERSKLLGHWEN